MNIACTACPARYGVADEKVNGKRVRITCKRCGTVLVVDGTSWPPKVTASTSIAPAPPAPASQRAPAAHTPAPAAPAPTFLVAFADGRQEQADVAQIVRFHRAGQLGPESVVWREGMADWQNPWDVEEVAAAFRRMGYTRPTPVPAAEMPRPESGDDEATSVVPSAPQHGDPLFDDDERTNIVHSSRLGREEPLPRFGETEPASSPVREEDEVPTHVAKTPIARARTTNRPTQETRRSERPTRQSTRPSTAQQQRRSEPARRRESARPSPLADRFARQAYAGSEDDEEARQRVAAAEAHGLMDATDEGQRLTGARNETSVLFSLDSLLKKEQPAAAPPPRAPQHVDDSLFVDNGPSLPIGGGFAPALAAPDFTAPITSPPPQPAPAELDFPYPQQRDGSRKWMILTGLVVLVSAGGFAYMSGALARFGLGPAAAVTPAPTVAPSAAPAPSAEAAPAASTSAEPQASAAPSASASAAPTATTTATSPHVAQAPARAPRPPSTGRGESETSEPSRPEPAATGQEAAASPTPAPAPAPAGGGGSFDAASAKTALTAAAGNASSCKEPGGPTGNGRVSITFAPSGRPTSVAVTGDLAGTTVGSCVARLFRQTRVPAFSGDPVTVAKGFSIE